MMNSVPTRYVQQSLANRQSHDGFLVVAEKKPRWTILARRLIVDMNVVRTISLADTENEILQRAQPVVLIDCDSFDFMSICKRMMDWRYAVTDPVFFAVTENRRPSHADMLKELGISFVYHELADFPKFKKSMMQFLNCVN